MLYKLATICCNHRKLNSTLSLRRTQPAPNLPNGPHDKLSTNYYLGRDARRLVAPPEEILSGGRKLLANTATSEGTA